MWCCDGCECEEEKEDEELLVLMKQNTRSRAEVPSTATSLACDWFDKCGPSELGTASFYWMICSLHDCDFNATMQRRIKWIRDPYVRK